jgi:hypothetical protein
LLGTQAIFSFDHNYVVFSQHGQERVFKFFLKKSAFGDLVFIVSRLFRSERLRRLAMQEIAKRTLGRFKKDCR